MRIGIPKEVKVCESRVALTPEHAAKLLANGHEVLVQSGAGVESGFFDKDYTALGIQLVESAEQLYGGSELIVKVKEPVAEDLRYLNSDHKLFCYLHLAANPELLSQLLAIGLTAIAFETVMVEGKLPLLAPMSEIAGKVAIQLALRYLHRDQAGSGILLGGACGSDPGKVTILGAGVAGMSATDLAYRMGAKIKLLDLREDALTNAKKRYPDIDCYVADENSIARAVVSADVLVGAVLVPGAKSPNLVTRKMIETMRKGSVVADIGIDQGGCIETIHATDFNQPMYKEAGVSHIGVTNLPGIVGRTATQVLSAAIIPYVEYLANHSAYLSDIECLHQAVNVDKGEIKLPALHAIHK